MVPPSGAWMDVPLAYTYDNAGHLLEAKDTGCGHDVRFGYDGLGRTSYECSAWSCRSMRYDGAGRLQWLRYHGAFKAKISQ